MTDGTRSLRQRRDTWLGRFAIAMFAAFGSAAAWELPGEGWATCVRVVATITFVASLVYGFVAWLFFFSAHWRLRRR